MHVSRFVAIERAAEAAARAAAILGSDRGTRDEFNDLRAVTAEVKFFAQQMDDARENLMSGVITPDQHHDVVRRLQQRLLTYLTPTE